MQQTGSRSPNTFEWARLSLPAGESSVLASEAGSCSEGLADALWICDVNTEPLGVVPPRADRIVLPAGEAGKSWPAVEQILRHALKTGYDRTSRFAAVGGGVVCDVAAFASSLYLRGVDIVLIPSTLLAMVDAAIGGKTGINFSGYKNMVGTFHLAAEVRIVPELVDTLPAREFSSGLAEVIKTAVLGDAELLELLEDRRHEVVARDSAVVRELVRRSVRVKVSIVQDDYLERGNRAFLNLGHTFAHALESVAGFGEWTHGEAVAWGIARSLLLGCRLGITEQSHADRIISLLDRYGYRTDSGIAEPDRLLSAMRKDKKRVGDSVRFVLSKGVGDTTVESVPDSEVRAIL